MLRRLESFSIYKAGGVEKMKSKKYMNMKKYDLFGYKVEVDKQATKEWYGKFKGWKCDCEHCKNFLLLAKKKQLPVIILDTLKEFEIPPEKPTYVCEITSKKDQLLYQFSYRMTGNVLQEKADTQEELEWGEARCCSTVRIFISSMFSMPFSAYLSKRAFKILRACSPYFVQ